MKRSILGGGLALVLLALLAGAAYTAVRLLTNQENLAVTAVEEKITDEGAAVTFANRIIPAAELPQREVDAWGTRRGDRLVADLLVYSLER